MGNERRRKKKKRLNWPAVLALMILLGGGGLAAVWQLKPELLEVFSAVGQSDAQEPGSADENPAPEEGSDAAPQNQYPVITLGADTVWVQAGSDFDPTANLTVTDPEDGELSYMQDSITPVPGTYTIISTVDLTTPGAYVVTVSAKNLSGAMSETGYSVRVLAEGEQPGSADATYIDGILLVSRDYPLPRNQGGSNAEANAALQRLQAAAAAEGHDLPLLSGYRSFDEQVVLFNRYVRKDGLELAIRYSAPPGQSEHQTGLCFDVASLYRTFATTEAGIWLNEHCAEYGFIIRYPENSEDITGYMYEPWHIRYVGEETAQAIMSQGITLEEYLGVA